MKNTYFNNWNFEKLNNWIDSHVGTPCRFIYNLDNGYKKEYADGNTYEFKFTTYKMRIKEFEVRINNEIVMCGIRE